MRFTSHTGAIRHQLLPNRMWAHRERSLAHESPDSVEPSLRILVHTVFGFRIESLSRLGRFTRVQSAHSVVTPMIISAPKRTHNLPLYLRQVLSVLWFEAESQ